MKYSFIILLIFCIVQTQLFAQSDFREGYIIKNSNDTVYGLIDYNGALQNAKICIFKKDENSKPEEYSPYDLKAYRYENSKYYVSRVIKTNNDEKRIFLEFLINGERDVFYYMGSFNDHYLIDIGDGELRELVIEEVEVEVDGKTYIKKKLSYVGLLKISFKDSPSISKEVENVSLSHKSLINISKKYHDEVCTDHECIVYEAKILKKKSCFGVLVGYNNLSISSKSNYRSDYSYFNNIDFGYDNSPSFGLFFKVNLPYLNEKLHFQYNLVYNKINLETVNYVEDPNFNLIHNNIISLSESVITNNLLLKSVLTNKKFNPTLIIGGNINFCVQSEYNHTKEYLHPWGESIYVGETDNSPFSTVDIGIIAGIGVSSKIIKGHELFLDLTYQRGFMFFNGLNKNTFTLNLGLQVF